VKLIVGLGNPGPQYEGTRHNVGFEVVDELAGRHGVRLASEKFHAWFAQALVAGEKVVLMKPTTFMNRSGRAVEAAIRFYRIAAEDLLVVTDDLALPVGRIRMRASGSAGGHNGLQDIIDRLGSDEWCRLRIGIGAAIGDPVVYVLGRFSPEERPVMSAVRRRAADAAGAWVTDGPVRTMSRFNGDVPL
jgi:PTH1 family peptidyl-tRNA hydrolase